MRYLLVLRRVAHLLGEPLYIFGDDVKDFFNHFVHAPEVANHMNTIFLEDSEVDGDFIPRYATGQKYAWRLGLDARWRCIAA